LFAAAKAMSIECVKILLDYGLSDKKKNRFGLRVIDVCQKLLSTKKDERDRAKLLEIVDLISKAEKKATLIQAVSTGNWSDVLQVLQKDPTLIDFRHELTGDTAVHKAIKLNYMDILGRLIEMKPKLTVMDKSGETPLQLARSMKIDQKYIDLLLKNRKKIFLIGVLTCDRIWKGSAQVC